VFSSSMQYSQGIMETVNDGTHVYYYTLREIPPDLEDMGRRVLKAFDVRERFFHFEFFRDAQGQLIALEVNMRPPGGMTTDMFNFANDIDIYREWANIVVHNHFSVQASRRYHCAYIGRKFSHVYAYSHEQILAELSGEIMYHENISGVFSAALGDYGYLVRAPELSEIHAMADYIHKPG
jgi:hypothetical protein